MVITTLDDLVSELHNIQKQIESVQIESDLRDKQIILNPNIDGLYYANGYYLNSRIDDPTATPRFVGNYQMEFDRWYRSYLRRQNEQRLYDLKCQEYQIRLKLWEMTGHWKQFDKENYSNG